MKQRNAELLLAGVIVARATSLLFSKLSMRALDPFNLLGLRFTIAFGLLMLLFGRRFRGVKLRTVFHGFLLGASFFAVMTAELFGLRATDSSTTSFLENTAIVWVPLLAALLRRRAPGRRDLGCAGLTLLGVGFLCCAWPPRCSTPAPFCSPPASPGRTIPCCLAFCSWAFWGCWALGRPSCLSSPGSPPPPPSGAWC